MAQSSVLTGLGGLLKSLSTPPVAASPTPPPSSPATPAVSAVPAVPSPQPVVAEAPAPAAAPSPAPATQVEPPATEPVAASAAAAEPPVAEQEAAGEAARLREQLRERERQLQSAVQQNAGLVDTIQKLQTETAELRRVPGVAEIDQLKTEFSKRIFTMEKRYAALEKENKDLRRGTDGESARRELVHAQEQLAARNKEVEALRAEGESLSRRQGAMESVLKRARAEKKDDDATIAQLREKLTAAEQLAEKRGQRVSELEAFERRCTETMDMVKELTIASGKQQEKWERQVGDLQAQKAELQSAVERSWREVSDLRRVNAQLQEQHGASATEALEKAQTELRAALEQARSDAAAREAQLLGAVDELRAAMQKAAEEFAWREEELTRENAELQRRLSASEARNESVASHALDATVPLLRQIEALQQTAAARTQAFEALEKSLRSQLHDSEHRLSETADALSAVTAKLDGVSRKAKTSEEESLKSARELQAVRSDLADTRKRLDAVATERDTASTALAAARSEAAALRAELDTNLAALRRYAMTQQQQLAQVQSPPAPQPAQAPRSPSPAQLLGGPRYVSSLAQRSELTALQEQISALKSSRSELDEEIVRLSTRNSELLSEVERHKKMDEVAAESEKRYQAALLLLGEREEQLAEMRLDIEDLKMTYRSQLDTLALQLEQKCKRPS